MEINVLSVKEIISNYKIFKSEKQKEALKSNFYQINKQEHPF